MEVHNVHTLAGWRFSEDYGIPSGIIWLRVRSLLSLMWDALSQTVLHGGRHGSRKQKGQGRNERREVFFAPPPPLNHVI